MQLSQFDYHLPPNLIARYPAERRDESRLLVVHRTLGTFEDRKFADIFEYVKPGDCIVLNNTKVIPARLFGTRIATGAKVEIFLNQRVPEGKQRWHVLAAPAKKV